MNGIEKEEFYTSFPSILLLNFPKIVITLGFFATKIRWKCQIQYTLSWNLPTLFERWTRNLVLVFWTLGTFQQFISYSNPEMNFSVQTKKPSFNIRRLLFIQLHVTQILNGKKELTFYSEPCIPVISLAAVSVESNGLQLSTPIVSP
jgi:hypothetical protein